LLAPDAFFIFRVMLSALKNKGSFVFKTIPTKGIKTKAAKSFFVCAGSFLLKRRQARKS